MTSDVYLGGLCGICLLMCMRFYLVDSVWNLFIAGKYWYFTALMSIGHRCWLVYNANSNPYEQVTSIILVGFIWISFQHNNNIYGVVNIGALFIIHVFILECFWMIWESSIRTAKEANFNVTNISMPDTSMLLKALTTIRY